MGTGNCTLPNFCDSGQGEKKLQSGQFREGRSGYRKQELFFFGPNYFSSVPAVLEKWQGFDTGDFLLQRAGQRAKF